MSSPARRLFSVALVAAMFAAQAPAAGPYDDLLKGVSQNTNTLVFVNPKAAYDSALGKAQKWDQKAKQNEFGALGFVPPDAELVVIASEVNFTSMARDFQIGLMKLRGNVPNMKDLAAREGGTLDEIAGRVVVASPRDVYFTALTGQELIAAFPADRQYTARWLRSVQAKPATLSPYLAKAAAGVGDNVLVAAVDLDEAFDPTLIRTGLGTSPTMVKHKGIDLGVLSKLVAGVQGMTFAAKVTDTVTGTITVEFKGDPSQYKRVVHDLFLEAIDGFGVSIPGLDRWEVKYTDRAMTLTGPMDAADLRLVLSLFAFPSGTQSEAGGKEEFSPTATRRYLDGADTILKSVRSMKDAKTSQEYAKTATWHDKAAAQLDQLSRRGVEASAVSAVYESSRRLQAIANSLRGVPIDVDALAKSQYTYVTMSGGGRGGWYHGRRMPYGGGGSSDIQTNVPEMQAKMQQAIADDQKKRLDLWNQIDRLMSDANRKLMELKKP